MIKDNSTSHTTLIRTKNHDGKQRSSEYEVIAANGRDKVISRDHDGDGIWETIETLSVTLNSNGSRTSVLDVRNADGSKRGVTSYTQSADTLLRTIQQDCDGCSAFDKGGWFERGNGGFRERASFEIFSFHASRQQC